MATLTGRIPIITQLLNGLIIATFTFIFSGLFSGVSFEQASAFWFFMGITVVIQDLLNTDLDQGKTGLVKKEAVRDIKSGL